MAESSDLIRADPAVDPGTHALVIGVGRYPHLIDGEGPLSTVADGMKQLSSPPISARAFADWLLNEYQAPGKELASLSLLLSEANPTPFEDPADTQRLVPEATAANVIEAIKRWVARAGTSRENRLIFYFCGHGISQGNDMALLTSDFGADPGNALNGSLDFRRLVGGLKTKCPAREQVFFVDACRASSDNLISRTEGFAGLVPFASENRPAGMEIPTPVTFYATLVSKNSHARPDTVSLFTEALLRSLRGAGSDEVLDDDWRVSTTRLQAALNHFMKEKSFAGRATTAQVPVAGDLTDFELHRLKDRPSVPVYVGCQTPDESARAQFVCRQNGSETARRDPIVRNGEDDTGEWVCELAYGKYEFVATLSPADVRTKEMTIRPVSRRFILEPQP